MYYGKNGQTTQENVESKRQINRLKLKSLAKNYHNPWINNAIPTCGIDKLTNEVKSTREFTSMEITIRQTLKLWNVHFYCDNLTTDDLVIETKERNTTVLKFTMACTFVVILERWKNPWWLSDYWRKSLCRTKQYKTATLKDM